MQEMIMADRDVILAANIRGTAWTSPRDLPVREAFCKAFATKQEMRNNKPRIIMYVEFDSEETDIVGYLLDLHRMIVRKEELVSELTIRLATVKTKDEKEIDKWKTANPPPLEGDSNL
eukprot:6660028-Ditylum_brightwellii.AAC.1